MSDVVGTLPSTPPTLLPPVGARIHRLLISADAAKHMALLLVSSAPVKITGLRTLIWDVRPVPPGDSHSELPMMETAFPPRVAGIIHALFRNFISVQKLQLHGHRFSSFRRIAQLVSSLPNLIWLRLTEVAWPTETFETVRSLPLCRSHTLRVVELQRPRSRTYSGLLYFLLGPYKKQQSGKIQGNVPAHALKFEDALLLEKVFAVGVAAEVNVPSGFMTAHVKDSDNAGNNCELCSKLRTCHRLLKLSISREL